MSNEYDDLLAKMNSVSSGEVRRNALRKSLRAMGKVVEAAIIEKAPMQSSTPHGDLKPGELKANIRTRAHVATDENAGLDEDYVIIGPTRTVEYVARFLEEGHATRPRTKESKRPRTDRVQPEPFVRPALDETEDKAIEVFGETMAEEIRKAFDA